MLTMKKYIPKRQNEKINIYIYIYYRERYKNTKKESRIKLILFLWFQNVVRKDFYFFKKLYKEYTFKRLIKLKIATENAFNRYRFEFEAEN